MRAGFRLSSGQDGQPGPGARSQELPGATAFAEGRESEWLVQNFSYHKAGVWENCLTDEDAFDPQDAYEETKGIDVQGSQQNDLLLWTFKL